MLSLCSRRLRKAGGWGSYGKAAVLTVCDEIQRMLGGMEELLLESDLDRFSSEWGSNQDKRVGWVSYSRKIMGLISFL